MPDVTPVAERVRERRHLLQHPVHVRDDIDAVDDETRPRRHAQRDVQHGAVLGDVDVLAAEHGVDPRPQPAGLGEVEQQFQRLRVDPVLGVVEIPTRGLDVHPVAERLGREQFAHGAPTHRLGVLPQRVPLPFRHRGNPRTASVGVRSEESRPTGSSP